MSPKKKKRAEKIEIAREKPKRRLIPFTPLETTVKHGVRKMSLTGFTAGKLPSVSKSMPPAASVIPLVSKEIPLVSAPIPLVSATPAHTLARKWGLPGKEWGISKIPATRRREVKRPKDIGLFKALGETIVSPVLGVPKMVEGIASALKGQAEEEKEPRVALEQQLLELKMRREMDEISEEDYKIEEVKLKRRIKDMEKKPETRVHKTDNRNQRTDYR